MREVFAVNSQADPGEVFYTITPQDVGHTRIETQVGVIPVLEVIGKVYSEDVGKRFYRLKNKAGDGYVWQVENRAQRDARLKV